LETTLTHMTAGETGTWRIDSIRPITGASLEVAPRLEIITAAVAPCGGVWSLGGFRSNSRYTTKAEQASLNAVQAGLGRAQATRGSLIPIRKNAAWWALAQDERRTIMEEQSRHIAIGLEYLPAIARRLYHSRDLGEPFDFLTWFEFAPEDEGKFDALVARLRASREWEYVDREVDIRLTRV
jgi:chlorite dismutase